MICISDEAHRSQINLDQKITVVPEGDNKGVKKTYGLAKYLHDSLPNATYVGFTGTPIDATMDVFGPSVDRYTMNESVKDKITVRIVYEGRAAKVLLDNSKLKDIEAYYAQCQHDGANEYQIEKIKLPNTKIMLLQKLLQKAIGEVAKTNKKQGVDFSKKLQAVVEKYNERKEESILVSDVINDFGMPAGFCPSSGGGLNGTYLSGHSRCFGGRPCL